MVKGLVEPGEEGFDAAIREFAEETGWPAPDGEPVPLGEVVLKSGKHVVAWGVEGDYDPSTLEPGTFTTILGGRKVEFPEIDRVRWCGVGEAGELLNPAQRPFLDRLESALGLR